MGQVKLCLGLAALLMLVAPSGALSDPAEELSAWPPAARARLAEFIEKFQGAEPRAYVVLDADNTLWQHDLEYALMAFLEAEGRISLARLPAELKLVEPVAGESLTSYYRRVCSLGKLVCTPWVARVFAGVRLKEARAAIGRMIPAGKPMQTFVTEGGKRRPVTIHPPRIYPAQVQLIKALRAAGIEVFVLTASLEELVRMVVSDPAYGIGLPPENVIGVNLLMRAPDGRLFAGAFERDAGRTGTDWFFSDERLKAELTTTLVSPCTWYIGKLAAIQRFIDPVARPVLVAGDAPTDKYMLLHADVARGGLRLFVRRKDAYWKQMQAFGRKRASATRFGPGDLSATQGWLAVTPEELLGDLRK